MTAGTLADIRSKAERRLGALTAQEPAQAHVRRRLGLPMSDPEALQRIAERYEPPAWVVGSISVHDAAFLYDMVRGVRPSRVIEVGVAAGCSTAILLTALADAGVPMVDRRGEPTLQSFDLHPWCYFDRTRPVGSAVLEMAPDLVGGLRLRTHATAVDAGRLWGREPVDLAFIDADHRHPCATADLLALIPALAPGAWVILHDIRLAEAGRRDEARTGKPVAWKSEHGAEWLFEAWPHERLTGGTNSSGMGGTNIGAIRLPERGTVTADDLRGLIDRPWETEPSAPVRELLAPPRP